MSGSWRVARVPSFGFVFSSLFFQPSATRKMHIPRLCKGTFPGPRGTFPQFPLATNHAVSSFLGGIGGKWGLQEFPKALVWHTAQAKSMILKGPGWLQEHSSTILADSNKKIIGLSSHGVAGMPKTAWLVVFGVPGKPFTWNRPGFHPGETAYPRETPGFHPSELRLR